MLEYFPPDNEKNDRVFFLPEKHQTPGTSNYKLLIDHKKNHFEQLIGSQVRALPERLLNSLVFVTELIMCSGWSSLYTLKKFQKLLPYPVLEWSLNPVCKSKYSLETHYHVQKKPQVCVDRKESSGFAFQISFFTSHIIMDDQKLIQGPICPARVHTSQAILC